MTVVPTSFMKYLLHGTKKFITNHSLTISLFSSGLHWNIYDLGGLSEFCNQRLPGGRKFDLHKARVGNLKVYM